METGVKPIRGCAANPTVVIDISAANTVCLTIADYTVTVTDEDTLNVAVGAGKTALAVTDEDTLNVAVGAGKTALVSGDLIWVLVEAIGELSR
jgi:hypothetical protein